MQDIGINSLTFKKCVKTSHEKKHSLITNCELPEDPTKIKCMDCIESFYKKLTWNNPYRNVSASAYAAPVSIYTSPSFLGNELTLPAKRINLDEIIKKLKKTCSDNSKYSKYLKYKNKYLQLKKSFAKN